MGFNAPTLHGDMRPGVWDQRQAAGTQAEGYNPTLSARIQQLPSYQAWVQSLQHRGATGAGVGGTREWKALIADLQRQGIAIPENEILDSDTGTVRGKTWMERHPVLSAVLITAGFAGGGYALGTALAGAGAGAGAGAAAGGTLPSTTIAPMAGALPAGTAGSGAVTAALGTTAPAAGAGLDAAWGAGETLPSSSTAPTAGTLPAGSSPSGAVPAALSTPTPSGGTSYSSLLSKYLIPGAADAVDAIINQKNADANRAQQLEIEQMRTALEQSKLDPNRGTMFQANDVGRLERMATPPPSYGPAAGNPYSAYVTPRPPPALSSTYLNTVHNAQSRVASGQSTMPDMTQSSNWGQTGTSDLSGAPSAAPTRGYSPYPGGGTAPTPGPSTSPISAGPVARMGPAPAPTPAAPAATPPAAASPYQGMSLASLIARYGPRYRAGDQLQGAANA